MGVQSDSATDDDSDDGEEAEGEKEKEKAGGEGGEKGRLRRSKPAVKKIEEGKKKKAGNGGGKGKLDGGSNDGQTHSGIPRGLVNGGEYRLDRCTEEQLLLASTENGLPQPPVTMTNKASRAKDQLLRKYAATLQRPCAQLLVGAGLDPL
eukprot:4705850-Pleurochrysis_carterae.AAC.1